MTEVRTRPYAGPADLRAMQGLARRIWTPSSRWHVGDLAWQRNQHTGREAEWPTALWEAGGEVVAWGWAELPGELALLVDPARPELAGAVLDWFAGVATAPRRSVTVLDAEPHLVAALEARGYERLGGPHFRHSVRALDDLPTPELPAGYRVRAVRGEEDVAARVAAHRAAWWPSRVTEESYRAVMGAWPYRPGLDWVVEGPDGRFAATCLIWFDERNGVGELEPVGVDPGLRRRGLGRAVCLAALGALREAGGRRWCTRCTGTPTTPRPRRCTEGWGSASTPARSPSPRWRRAGSSGRAGRADPVDERLRCRSGRPSAWTPVPRPDRAPLRVVGSGVDRGEALAGVGEPRPGDGLHREHRVPPVALDVTDAAAVDRAGPAAFGRCAAPAESDARWRPVPGSAWN